MNLPHHETWQVRSVLIKLERKVQQMHALAATLPRRRIECVKVLYLTRSSEKKAA